MDNLTPNHPPQDRIRPPSRLRLRRLRALISIEALAEAAGMAAGGISEAERGLIRLTPSRRRQLIAALEEAEKVNALARKILREMP